MDPSDIEEDVFVTPPRVTIDLSLPARERYKALAQSRASQLRSLTSLFNDLLLDLKIPQSWLRTVNGLSSLLLRRVFDTEQTEELRGISEVTDIPMYLLVAFNVVLDLLMGCTSGGVRSNEEGQSHMEARMLHFRTLDWGMDPLRKTIVQLDYVRSGSSNPTAVVASSITYVGFVGVLTGVRPGLSMSLNFRAVHDATNRRDHLKFYIHHLMVLLGQRPSIASILRSYLIQAEDTIKTEPVSLEVVTRDIIGQRTTAAYLILSNGDSTVIIEKDFLTCTVASSQTFIARTNHDVDDHHTKQSTTAHLDRRMVQVAGLNDFLGESRERLGCIAKKWRNKVRREHQSRNRHSRGLPRTNSLEDAAESVTVTQAELITWLCTWTTTNECTHYAVIMDPQRGSIRWAAAYPEPLGSANVHNGEWVRKRTGRAVDFVSVAATAAGP